MRLVLAGLAIAVLVYGAGLAAAATDTAATPEPGLLDQVVGWIFVQQRAFHRELTGALSGLADGGGAAAGWGLVLASFLYGVFHAAGPGHGKAIVTTYLLTHRQRMARGVMIAVAGAFCQGLTALFIVYGLIILAGWLPSDASAATGWSERLSYALVMLLGGLLAVRALSRLTAAARRRLAPGLAMATAPGSAHVHHDHENHCGHSHGPSADEIGRATGAFTILGLILSIGMRPCSGAVLVLVFAYAAGIALAGIAAVAAMSAGTALAVAGLAFLAVHARQWISARFAGGRRSYRSIADLAALGGGALIALIGVSLLIGSFGPAHPLGL